MNVRKGMRRLGIFLGILGGSAGTFMGYTELRDLLAERAAYKRFEYTKSLPIVQALAAEALKTDWVDVKEPSQNQSTTATAAVNRDGIKQVTVDRRRRGHTWL